MLLVAYKGVSRFFFISKIYFVSSDPSFKRLLKSLDVPSIPLSLVNVA